jgi:hypothetical protein
VRAIDRIFRGPSHKPQPAIPDQNLPGNEARAGGEKEHSLGDLLRRAVATSVITVEAGRFSTVSVSVRLSADIFAVKLSRCSPDSRYTLL